MTTKKHERRIVGHASGWQEKMDTCVCGKQWPCVDLVSNPMNNAAELRMLVVLQERSRDYVDKAMLSAAVELDRLNEVLTFPSLSRDPNPEQYKVVLRDWEKSLPVNGQDLINALAWRVDNQRREIARLNEALRRKVSDEAPSFSPNFDGRNGIR